MISMARALDMKVMIGCMTETSCAVTAAAQLSPLVDWADLDGNLLIDNDLFEGIKIKDGKIILPELPGIGITKSSDLNINTLGIKTQSDDKKKNSLWSCLHSLLAIILGAAIYLNSLLPIITGYAAKNLCSAVFVSGRTPEDVENVDLNFSFIKYTRN